MSERNVRLLSSDEQKRCYAIPQFTETERDHYFTLLPAEKLHFDGLRNTATRVHFILQLAYFKCKRRLFGFTLTSVKNDIAYNRQRNFQDQPARAMTLPSRETMGRNNRHILRLYDYSNSRKDAQTLFQQKIGIYLHQSTCPVSITQQFMGALKQRNIVIPAYTTLQTWLQGALTTEEKRIERCIRRYLNTKTRNQLDVLLTTDCEHNLQTLKTDPKNFRYQQMQQHLKAFAEYFSLYQHIIIVMPKLRLSKQSIAYYASLIDY